jgi:hypothetical protein
MRGGNSVELSSLSTQLLTSDKDPHHVHQTLCFHPTRGACFSTTLGKRLLRMMLPAAETVGDLVQADGVNGKRVARTGAERKTR